MKVAIIGGGSSYTPELISGFLERTEPFPMTELWLMDISPERLDIVGGFAQRMVAAKGSLAKGTPFAVRLTTDQREAVRGADEPLPHTDTIQRVWRDIHQNPDLLYFGLYVGGKLLSS